MGRPRKQPVTVDGVVCWRCPKCKETKPESEFGPDNRQWMPCPVRSWCLACEGTKSTKRYHADLAKSRRMHRNYQRARAEKYGPPDRGAARKETARKNNARTRAMYPDMIRAGSAINNAISAGKLTKPDRCEMCGRGGRIQGHHDSYDRDRWLTVTWFCDRCHKWTHYKRREQRDGIANEKNQTE